MKIGIPHRLAIQKKLSAADLQRFMSFVEIDADTGCWIWTGTKDRHGYGQFWWGDRMHWAHRWSLAAFRADIPRNHDADHKEECRNPSCVAPFHVQPKHRTPHGRQHQPESRMAEVPI